MVVGTPSRVNVGVNFNPTLAFDAGDGMRGASLMGTATYAEANVYVVSKMTTAGNSDFFEFGNASTARIGVWEPSTDNIVYWDGGSSSATNRLTAPSGTIAAGVFELKSYNASTTANRTISSPANTRQAILKNAKVITSDTTMASFTGGNKPYSIGGLSLDFNDAATATLGAEDLAEVIVFTSAITSAQQQQIHSYLALKYGITLDQTAATNYVGSNSAILWNGTTNAAYNKNIAGIGRDDASGLNQKQSRSVNTASSGNLVTIGLGPIAADNASNANTFGADRSVLIWGDDQGALFLSNAVSGSSLRRMTRLWRVQETGTIGAVQVRIPASFLPGTNPSLIRSTDATFTGGDTIVPLTLNGANYEGTTDFSNGDLFTFAALPNAAPGGIGGGLALWLKANAGTPVNGSNNFVNGTGWVDQSGNNRNATIVLSDPQRIANGINFNPTVRFDGNDYLRFASSPFVTAFTAGEVFSVPKSNQAAATNSGNPFDFGGGYNSHYVWSNDAVYNEFGTSTRLAWNPATKVIVANEDKGGAITTITGPSINPRLYSIYGTRSQTAEWGITFNGANVASTAIHAVNFTLTATNETVGALGASPWNGELPEVFLYNRVLTGTERQQVTSYLAIKYGITQWSPANGTQDYLSSQAATIWSGVANSAYHNDVAGMGRDDASALDQRQSLSINANSFPTIGNGAIAADNVSNSNPFGADQSFFIWGRSTGTINQNVAIAASNVTRMARIWRAQESGTVGPVVVRVPAAVLNGTLPVLIRSTDATFTSGDTFVPMALVGSNYETTTDFAGGVEFFTFGSVLATPGGVGGEALWLRADLGTSCTTENCTVPQWDDQSGNGKDATTTTGTVSRKSVGVNFNPIVAFDAGDGMRGPTLMGTSTFNHANLYIVSSKKVVGAYPDFTEYGAGATTGIDAYQPYTDNIVYFDAGVGASQRLTAPAGTVVLGQFELKSYNASTTANQTFAAPANTRQAISKNGKLITSDTTLATFAGANLPYQVGGSSQTAAGAAITPDGVEDIAEVILYTSAITAVQHQAIESYLAIKYGVTLDQTTARNYVASDGATVTWNGTANAGYKTNVAGIGRDDVTGLAQRQSKSINAGEFVTIGLGAIAADNASNTSNFAADTSFLTWGHDNGSASWGTVVTATSLRRMPRIWKVQETGTVGGVVVRIPKTMLGGVTPMLLRSVDPTFDSTDTQIPMTLNGAYLEAPVDFATNDYFTFASQDAPAVQDYGDGFLMDGTRRGAAPAANTAVCFANQFWNHLPLVQKGVYTNGNVGVVHGGFTGAESTFLADVNNDGNLDLLAVYDAGGTVSANGTWAWLGNGDGTFQTAAIRDTGSFTGGPLFPAYAPFGGGDHDDGDESTHIADVTGDGSVDIVWIWDGGGNANAGTWVWPGNGDGTFQHTPIIDHGHAGGSGFATARFGGYTGSESTDLVDVNNDGKLDVVWVYDAAYAANSGVWVWLGNGDGTWSHTVVETHGLQGQTTGGFSFPFSPAGGVTGNESTHLVDIDKDGFVDVVWVYDGGAASTAVSGVWTWRGNGNGTFQTAKIIDIGFVGGGSFVGGPQGGQSVTQTTRVVDVNRDGNLDVVWIYDGGGNPSLSGTFVYLGNGNGTFNHTPLLDLGAWGGMANVADIIQAGYNGGQITLMGDLNGDGVHDILWSYEAAGVVANSGTWVWLGKDTDGDGLADIVDTDDDGDGIADTSDTCNSPGSVSPSMQLWLKADQGLSVDASSNVIHWADQTPANRDANLVSGDPAKADALVNFNPAVRFDGNDWFNFGKSPFVTSYTAGEVFSVQRSTQTAATNGAAFELGDGSRTPTTNYSTYVWSDGGIYEGFGTTDRFGWNPVTKVIADPHPGFTSVTGPSIDVRAFQLYTKHSAANDWGARFNGTQIVSTATNTVSFALVGGNEHVGAVSTHPFTGDIAEVILYNRKLTTVEREQVESYLGTKYGITLGHSYRASDDTTLYWDMAANATYHNDVAGIGRDDDATLYQKQSASINPTSIVAMGLGTIETTNQLNTSTLATDRTFMMWGSDTGALVQTTLVANTSPVLSRLERVWKVQETQTVGQVVVRIPQTALRGTSPTMIRSIDPTFDSTDELLPMAINGTDYEVTIDYNNGDYFTFAAFLPAPGGVTANLGLWLRADQGVTLSGSNASQWDDQSSGANNAVQGTAANRPLFQSAPINFNPGLLFDGSTSYMDITGNVGLSGTTPLSLFGAGSRQTNATWDGYIAQQGVGPNTLVFGYSGTRIAIGATSASGSPGGSGVVAGTGTHAANTPELISLTRGNGGTDIFNFYGNGGADGTSTFGLLLASGNTRIGGRVTGTDIFDGTMTETIAYNRTLSASELLRVHSYLAIRNGVTLSQTLPTNYVDSLGSPIWTAATNAGYASNIAGIGRDDASALVQRQSQSVNTASIGNLVTIGLGTIDVDNVTNPNGFPADRNFLTWGDNSLATTFSVTLTPPGPGVASRMARVWRTQETGTIGTVRIGVPPTLGAGVPVYLVVSNDASFDATDAWVPMGAFSPDGLTIYLAADRDVTSGQYFTFATVLPLDFGDAPASYGTLLAANGARHGVPGYDAGSNTAPLMLGATIDVDAEGLPNATATGDDADNAADEDSVVFPALIGGQSANLAVTVGNSGPAAVVSAWADWNGNGNFADAGEQFAVNAAVAAGANAIPIVVPANVNGPINVRFRLSTQTGLAPTGAAPDGEVEDYQVVVTSETDLAITKTDGQTSYVPGAAVSYTIVITNAGPSNATGISVSDTVPPALSNVSASCAASGTAACGTDASLGNSVLFTGAIIPVGVGNQLTVTVSGVVDPSTTGSLDNTATVIAGSSNDSNTANNAATDSDAQDAGSADLQITKTDGQAGYVAGSPVSYTVTVTNAGPSHSGGFNLTDVVPANITGVSVSCVVTGAAVCGTDASSGNTVAFTGATVNAGGGNNVTLTISGTISPSATGNLSNTAQIVIPGGSGFSDPNLGNNSATDTDSFGIPQVDLAITKTDGQSSYVPGAPVTYTLVVTNAGPSTANGFSIADTVPVSITGVSATCAVVGLGSCGTNATAGNAVSFTNANLAPGATNTLTITVTGTVSPNTTSDLTNIATVTAPGGVTETNPANNSASDTDTQGAGLADLRIVKTDGQAGFVAGTPVTYTLTITNLGPSHASAFTVDDLAPAMIAGVSVSCATTGTAACGTNASAGNHVTFTGASVNAGAGNAVTITVSGTIDSTYTSGSIANTAQIDVPTGAGYSDPAQSNNSSTDTDTPLPQHVDLAITKTNGRTSYTPGAPVTYTLVVTNAGPSTATDLTISDVVTTFITGVTASCVVTGTGNCGVNTGSGNAIAFSNATLAPGAPHALTITISGIVSPEATGPLANTATVTQGTGATETNSPNNSATDTDTQGANIADLILTKTDGAASYTPGGDITYQLVVTNQGPSHASGFDLSDTLAAAILSPALTCTVSSGVGTCGTNATAGNAISFTGAALNAGSSLTLTVIATVDPSATGDLVNTASVVLGGGATFTDPDTANNSALDTDTQGTQTIDLAVTKDDAQTTYVAGTPISYTVTVTNSGPSTATGFSITDTVPPSIAGVTVGCVASGSSNCGSDTSTGNALLFTNATLIPSDTLTLTISGIVTTSAVGDLVNTARLTIASGANDTGAGNNSATDTDTAATPQTNLTITKSDAQSTYVPGTPISYTITVSNLGPSSATAFSIVDTVPAPITGMTVTCAVSGTGDCGIDATAGNAISFTGASLEPGGGNMLTLTVNGTVSASTSGALANTATVTAGAGQIDPTPGNNSATDTNTVGTSQIDLTIAKTDGQAAYVPGTAITYTITVTNAGPSAAVGFSLSDVVPVSITGVSASCAVTGTGGCGTNASSGNNVSFTGLGLAPGAGNTLTFTVTGSVSPAAAGTITNTASVAAGAGSADANPADNTATDIDTAGTPQTDLTIAKTDGQASYVAGAAISYTVTVTNAGPSNATSFDVNDLVPSAITGVSVSCVAAGTAACGTNAAFGNSVSYTNATLAAGGGNVLTFTINGIVDPSTTGALANTATVTAGGGATDPTLANNTATDTDTQATLQVDLAITKTDGQASYVAGTPVSYTIVISNSGPSTAIGASIADSVPSSITGISVSCVASGSSSCGTNASSGQNVSFTGVSVVPGAAHVLTITVSGTVDPAATGSIVNTATVAAGAGSTDTTPGNNSATDTDTQAAGVADLTIAKTDGQASYVAGTPISYTVTVTNAGPSNAGAFTITDMVPATITGVSVSCAATGTGACGTNASSGNSISFTGATLGVGPGHTLTLTINGMVSPSATGTLSNTAQLVIPGGAGFGDPNLGDNSATDVDAAGSPQVDLTITKTDGRASYVPGAPIAYTVTVTNAGPSMATGFSVTDVLPVAFSNVTATCAIVGFGSCGTDSSAGTTVSFTNATLAPGAVNTLTVSITGTVSPNATGSLVNTATVIAGAGATEANPADNTATDTNTQGAGEADLAITKTDGQAGYIAGTPVSYTLTISNAGPSHATPITGFEIHDAIPSTLIGVSISCATSGTASCGTNSSSGNTLTFTGASLNAGAGNSLTITVNASVDPNFTGGNIVNTAQVVVPTGAGYDDPSLANNTVTDTDTPLPQQVDLSITKSNGQASYVPGTSVTYTIVVTNSGPSTATGVSIADVLPATITGVTASCVSAGVANCGSNGTSGNNVSFTNASIYPGAGHQLTITVTGTISPDTTGSLANTATVTRGAGAIEPNTANNSATDTDTQGGSVADLSITKTDGVAIYTAGTAITYQIVVSNSGPSHASAFSIADVVPASIAGGGVTCSVSSGVGTCGTNASAGNNVRFTGATLNVGGSLTLVVTGTINPSATGDLVNTATLTGGGGFTDPTASNDSATDTNTATAQAIDLIVTKDNGQASYVPGTPVSYTVTVTNGGPSTATGFSIADAVPASITGLTVTCAATSMSSCGSDSSSTSAGVTNVLYSNATLVPGDTITLTIAGTIAPSTTGNLANTTTVTAGPGANEANTSNNSATDTDTQGTSIANLAVTKTNGQTTYVAGTAVSYTITVSNAGPSTATGVSLTDVVPASITGMTVTCAVTGTGTCGTDGSSGNTIAFTGLTLEPGAGNALTFVVNGTIAPSTTGALSNTASVSAGAGATDPVPANNTATDTDTAATAQVDLAITKTDGQTCVRAGHGNQLHGDGHERRSVDGHRRVDRRHRAGRDYRCRRELRRNRHGVVRHERVLWQQPLVHRRQHCPGRRPCADADDHRHGESERDRIDRQHGDRHGRRGLDGYGTRQQQRYGYRYSGHVGGGSRGHQDERPDHLRSGHGDELHDCRDERGPIHGDWRRDHRHGPGHDHRCHGELRRERHGDVRQQWHGREQR